VNIAVGDCLASYSPAGGPDQGVRGSMIMIDVINTAGAV
jgi:hypothetical protein